MKLLFAKPGKTMARVEQSQSEPWLDPTLKRPYKYRFISSYVSSHNFQSVYSEQSTRVTISERLKPFAKKGETGSWAFGKFRKLLSFICRVLNRYVRCLRRGICKLQSTIKVFDTPILLNTQFNLISIVKIRCTI